MLLLKFTLKIHRQSNGQLRVSSVHLKWHAVIRVHECALFAKMFSLKRGLAIIFLQLLCTSIFTDYFYHLHY